jgi:hypothetical protein
MSDSEWNRERLEQIISEKIEEHSQLDYKAAASLDRSDKAKAEITKDVSAFANSNGGTIIYGVAEFADKKHLPEKVDPVDGKAFSKEWLDQIIGQIQPRVAGLRIIPVRVGPGDTDLCYVVEIPRGETAHQAKDLKYYRRYNFESVAMQDYEIRDVMGRRSHPKLDLKVRLFQTPISTVKVTLCVKNVGTVIPHRYGTVVLLPQIIKGKLYREGLMHQPLGGHSYWRFLVEGKEPAYPQSDAYSDFEIPYTITHEGQLPPGPENLFCTLYADEMPSLKREISVAAALAAWV